jgi:hypothetical protein
MIRRSPRLHIAQRLPDRPHSSLRLLSLMLTPSIILCVITPVGLRSQSKPRSRDGGPVPVRLNVTATACGGTSLAKSTVLAEPGPIAEPVRVSTTRRGLAPQYSAPVAGAGVLDWSQAQARRYRCPFRRLGRVAHRRTQPGCRGQPHGGVAVVGRPARRARPDQPYLQQQLYVPREYGQI